MLISLPPLPYDTDSLEPFISQKTLEIHYGKHHQGYVKKLNELIKGTHFENDDLEEIIMQSFAERENQELNQKIYNNAGQTWNHSFYWNCMSSEKSNQPSSDFTKILEKNFNSMEEFYERFKKECMDIFGSGWLWLVKDADDKLTFAPMANAGNPIVVGQIPPLIS